MMRARLTAYRVSALARTDKPMRLIVFQTPNSLKISPYQKGLCKKSAQEQVLFLSASIAAPQPHRLFMANQRSDGDL